MKRARSLALATAVLGSFVAPARLRAEQPTAPAAPAPAPAPLPTSAPSPTPPAAAPTPPAGAEAATTTPPAAAPPASSEATQPVAPPVVAAPPAAATPAAAAQRSVLSPGEAVVHVAVTHRDAWLETRSSLDGGEFVRTCLAPCDIKLQVEGREARVVAPGMTTSNVFRFDAGAGIAGVRVEGGSAAARRAGAILLAAGIPVALAGMGLFAQGRVKERGGLEVAGIAGLAAGGLSISISLPLLVMGTTHVKNAKGSLIALAAPSPAL